MSATNTRAQAAQEMAIIYGVSIGDTVQIGDESMQVDALDTWIDTNKELHFGVAGRINGEAVKVLWNPDTCQVMERGEPA